MRFSSVRFATLTIATTVSFQVVAATVESIASEIAKQHNTNAHNLRDEMTVSSSAKAVGKNVIVSYVQRVRKDVPSDKLAEYQAEMYKEIVPQACKANANNPAFKDGLYYTFVYTSHYGQKLAEFSVSKQTCNLR